MLALVSAAVLLALGDGFCARMGVAARKAASCSRGIQVAAAQKDNRAAADRIRHCTRDSTQYRQRWLPRRMRGALLFSAFAGYGCRGGKE